jgi:hypothetical protein
MRRRHVLTLTVAVVWMGAGLWVESRFGASSQVILGITTACVLVALLLLHPPSVRAQTLVVVAVATLGEVVGSLLWGLYSYRLDNLPSFVPPGHGLVYLAGLGLAGAVGRHGTPLVAAAATAVAAWGVLGVTALPALDVAGVLGCSVLAAVLVATRRPVYAGVFVVVAAVELYGTALGTWTWEATIPGLGIPQGNPPSGVASGYVLFDVAALAAVGRLARTSWSIGPARPFRGRPVTDRVSTSP